MHAQSSIRIDTFIYRERERGEDTDITWRSTVDLQIKRVVSFSLLCLETTKQSVSQLANDDSTGSYTKTILLVSCLLLSFVSPCAASVLESQRAFFLTESLLLAILAFPPWNPIDCAWRFAKKTEKRD